MKETIRNIEHFFYWAMYELISSGGGKVTKIVQIPSRGDNCLVLDSEMFGNYVTKELGVFNGYYFAKFRSDGDLSMLGR